MNNKKGFTLAELLIVVAIIAVLTAVAVPIFSTQLEKSREETDIGNLRSAKAAAVAAYLAEEKIDNTNQFGATATGTGANTAYFDASAGKLTATKPSAGYGKGTNTNGGCESFECGTTDYTGASAVSGQLIQVTVTAGTGAVELTWVDP